MPNVRSQDQAQLPQRGWTELVREPLLILDGAQRVAFANPAFYETFRLLDIPVQGLSLHELLNDYQGVRDLERLVEHAAIEGSGDRRVWLGPEGDEDELQPYRVHARCDSGELLLSFEEEAVMTPRSEQALANELNAVGRLHKMTLAILKAEALPEALEAVLFAAVELLGADFGTVRLLNLEHQCLDLVAYHGFDPDFIEGYRSVPVDAEPAFRDLLGAGERLTVSDVASHPGFDVYREQAIAAGFQAMQSAPLVSCSGEIFGVLTTHYRQPRILSECYQKLMDLLARQGADLIERKRAQEAVRRSDIMLRGVYDNIPIMLCVWDPELQQFQFNKCFVEKLGWTLEDTLDGKFLERVYPDPVTREEVRRFMREEQGAFRDFRTRKRDGTLLDCSWANVQLADERSLGIGIDISERKEHERDMERARDAAEAAARAKSAFLANMSHDIRTPLTGILGFAGILKEGAGEQQEEIAQQIEESGHMLLETLDSVLQLSRLEGGKVELKLERLDLREELPKICMPIAGAAANRKERIRVELDEEDTQLFVRADRGALQRVLHNAVGNALKFSEDDTVVSVRARRSAAGSVRVEVADQGSGMSKEFLKRAFEPFSQEREKQRKGVSGSGLGLAIIRQLTQLMGGDVSIDSTQGKGTTVSFSFPILDAPEAGSGTEPRQRRSRSTGAGKCPPQRILVCEDYEPTRRVVGMILHRHEVEMAENAEELMARAQGQDFILLDINLNGQNQGEELLQKLRRMPGNEKSRIVAFTAHNLPGERERFLRAGFDGYLAKPFSPAELIDLIDELAE